MPRNPDFLTNAIEGGHFLLNSGRHSRTYFEKWRALEYPEITRRLVRRVIRRYDLRSKNIQAVVGPRTGGMIVAYEVAKELKIPCFFVGETSDAAGEWKVFGHDVQIDSGPLLLADDVWTMGGSLRRTKEAVLRNQPNAEVVGAVVLLDRSDKNSDVQREFPVFAAIRRRMKSYSPDKCPQCRRGLPITQPGTKKQ